MAQTDASIFPLEFLKKKLDSQKINPYFLLVIKNVSHTISQILRVTEIQQFRSNQLMLKNR